MTRRDELFAAIDADDAPAVSAIVSQDPALASARGDDGVSAVLHARYRHARATTDALLAADPDLDVFDAAALGYLDRLRGHLIDDPALATAFTTDGFTALHLAAFFGKAQAARVLIDAGASVAAFTTNAFANQPLHAAAAGRHVEVARVLLAAGADIDMPQHGGYTPLHEAAASGDVELVELFLSAGASPSATADDGWTPAQVAEAAGHTDLARRLREVAESG